ncbi:MAG TPA: VanZ family protein [Nitrospira sp.]|nr:VanZ family protein [Nitrospira sp.]
MGLLGPSLYLLLLIFGCLATPGTGIAGSLLAVVPQPVTDYSHVPAYALLTWLLAKGLQTRGWSRQSALQTSVVAAMVFGVGMELLQAFVPGRTVDIHDVAYNAVGIAAAALLLGTAPDAGTFAVSPKFLRSRK